jgi:hypothetical protein
MVVVDGVSAANIVVSDPEKRKKRRARRDVTLRHKAPATQEEPVAGVSVSILLNWAHRPTFPEPKTYAYMRSKVAFCMESIFPSVVPITLFQVGEPPFGLAQTVCERLKAQIAAGSSQIAPKLIPN